MISINARPFGTTREGTAVTCYEMKNSAGMSVSVLDYGCTIQSICVPDRNGFPVDVALGYDTISDYEQGNCYFGALVGRYANRIRGARFVLNGRTFLLEPNEGKNHLHGIFSRCVFSALVDKDALVLHRVSPAGEEGFPGTLSLTVRYRLTEQNALILEYMAETDDDTVVNLTNHTYFNLNGRGDVLGHILRLNVDRFLQSDSETLPTGELLSVDGTPFDYREEKAIGEGLKGSDPQLALCGGFDHHYVLEHAEGTLLPFADIIGDRTGIRMRCATTQPGVQFYSGNYIHQDSAAAGKHGVRYGKHAGFCLETQHAPDSPNQPHFPTTVLRPGERYFHKTVFQFF